MATELHYYELDASDVPPGYTDDEYLQELIDSVNWSSSSPLHLVLTGQWWVENTVVFAPPIASTGRVYVDGLGCKIRWNGADGNSPTFQFGTATKKIWWSKVSGMTFTYYPGSAPNTSIHLENCNDMLLSKINGGGEARGLTTAPLCNYLHLTDCYLGGSEVCADINGNVVAIENCKFTNGSTVPAAVGLRYSGTTLSMRGCDVSFCTQTGIELNSVGNIDLHCYFEKIGPKLEGNDAKCLHVNVGWGISLSCMLNCVWGSNSMDTHCAYGAYLEDVEGLEFRGGYIQHPQVAGIHLDDNCQDIFLRGSCRWWKDKGDGVLATGNTAALVNEANQE